MNNGYTYTEEDLISEIHRFIKENGKIPTADQMTEKTNRFPSATTYISRFGSWNDALCKAKLRGSEYLISELERFINENKKIPKARDMKIKKGYPSIRQYQIYFGSWNNALDRIGVHKHLIKRNYTENSICYRCKNVVKYRGNSDKCGNLICFKCWNKEWRSKNKDVVAASKLRTCQKRRKYNNTPLNSASNMSERHHVWLEGRSDFVIYMPYFLHQLYPHKSNIEKQMDQINPIALDYWINEEMYNELYTDDILLAAPKRLTVHKILNVPPIDYKNTSQSRLETYILN